MSRLGARFRSWSQVIDPDVRASIGDPEVWLAITVLMSIVLAGAIYLPNAQQFFGLDVLPPILAFLPALLLGAGVGWLEQRRRLSALRFALLALIDSTFGQFFTWSLVACSHGPGATVMVAFPTILACYHGHALRSPPEYPFVALASAVALAGAVFLNHDPDHLPLYAVAGPLAIGGCLVLGKISGLQYASQRERSALREAVDAQVLNAQTRRLEEIAGALLEMQGNSHDAGNALSGLTMSAERIVVVSNRRPFEQQQAEDLSRLASGLVDALGRLERLLSQARAAARSQSVPNQLVELGEVGRTMALEMNSRFASTQVQWELDVDVCSVHVEVCGGRSNLERLLTNLVLNACEGDGRTQASTVLMSASVAPRDNRVTIEIVDDGPGLNGTDDPFRAFRSTKPRGTGLGLYTSRQLARASGGALSLANRTDAQRGAIARLELRGGVFPR